MGCKLIDGVLFEQNPNYFILDYLIILEVKGAPQQMWFSLGMWDTSIFPFDPSNTMGTIPTLLDVYLCI